MVGFCEDGDEPVGFITCMEFLDQRENSQLLKKDSASFMVLVF
jgi:hypothetical protein